MRIFATLLALTTTPALAQTIEITATPDAPVITVTATENVEAAPDIATMRIGVETNAPTAVAALQLNSTKMTRVIAAIRAQGVELRDVRTNTVSVSARYDYQNGRRVFLGHQATNSVTVILREIGKAGPFLDAMTAAGANNVDGPTFAIDKLEPLQDAARDRAARELDANAQAMARRLGFARARLLSMQESGSFSQPLSDIIVTGARGLAPQAVSAPPPPVAGGTQAVGVTFSGMYRLER